MNQSAFVALPATTDHHDIAPANIKDEFLRVTQSVLAIGAATYHWNIASDEIVWHGDIAGVFNSVDENLLGNGRAYASLLDPDNFTSRFETVMRNTTIDEGAGVPFSIDYAVKPFGRDQEQSIWIEDAGRWHAGPDGRPVEVYGVVRQIDEQHKQDQHLLFLRNCDPLTGMLNRGRLTEVLGEAIELARIENHTSAFLILSVSNLAVVNEAYGFDVADDIIVKIGQRLRKVLRSGDTIGRYSGSKFGLIMSRATKEELHVAAERFLTIAREKVIETDLGPVWAILSIGGKMLPESNEDANLTMAHAEEALTEAIKLPTDGVIVYTPSVELVSERKLNSRCAVEIVQGLKENNFTLAYQPIVNAQTREVEFHEALLRMKSENGDIITAGHLIPIAEKLGLVRLIDQLVVVKVLSALRQFPEAKIALNISGVTANDPRWFAKITEILEANTDITDRLTIEITETVALDDIEQTVSFIKNLHTLGCKVAIDDFGAGFTSFKNLKTLNVDKVKIDGSFCQNLSQNKDNQFFVRTLIDLSKKFGLEVVAEWVENEEDAQLLSSWDVDFLQGHFFGMAESASPWGDPINDDDATCIIPSEIFHLEPDELTESKENEPEQNSVSNPFKAVVPENSLIEVLSESNSESEISERASVPEVGQLSDQDSEIQDETEILCEEDSDPLDDELNKFRSAIEQLNKVRD